MTDQQRQLPPQLPKRIDRTPLTVGELDTASRAVRTNVPLAALDPDHPRWLVAQAAQAWLYAKRDDRRASLDDYLSLSFAELAHVLRLDDELPDVDDVEAQDQQIDAHPPALDQLAGDAGADVDDVGEDDGDSPTVPTPAL